MRKLKSAAVFGVGLGLFTASWVLLGALALGNRFISPIERNDPKGDGYV
jgi:hypothetical protein